LFLAPEPSTPATPELGLPLSLHGMARNSFFLVMITGIAALLSCTTAAEIWDVFTVQGGSRDGGCDSRMEVLDQWLSEASFSLDATLVGMDTYDQDPRVRRAMSKFFGLNINPPRLSGSRSTTFNTIRNYIDYVKNFLENIERNGAPVYNNANFWLHCDSTFLSLHQPTDPALDFQANEMEGEDGNTITIEDVPKYQELLRKDAKNRPWWAGEITSQNGYYFTEYGGNYCYDDDLGVTAAMQLLERNAAGQAEAQPEKAAVILCPFSFDGSPQPNSWREANNLLAPGVSLHLAVPKSATLVHEAFHALHGTAFLSGAAEKYDIGECMNLNAAKSRTNPENYVFFIAHMYHMFGVPDEDEPDAPWSIPTQWDFQTTLGDDPVYGAFSNPL
ncbi:hypothetical protein CI238_12874, partial [Colletotrichum incanum]